EDVHQPAVDGAEAGHDSVARGTAFGQAEVLTVVGDEDSALLEGAAVEKQPDALARRQAAALVLAGEALWAATFEYALAAQRERAGRGGAGGRALDHGRDSLRACRALLRRGNVPGPGMI